MNFRNSFGIRSHLLSRSAILPLSAVSNQANGERSDGNRGRIDTGTSQGIKEEQEVIMRREVNMLNLL